MFTLLASPSPSPAVNGVGTGMAINAAGIIGAAIFVAVAVFVVYRNMKSNG